MQKIENMKTDCNNNIGGKGGNKHQGKIRLGLGEGNELRAGTKKEHELNIAKEDKQKKKKKKKHWAYLGCIN